MISQVQILWNPECDFVSGRYRVRIVLIECLSHLGRLYVNFLIRSLNRDQRNVRRRLYHPVNFHREAFSWKHSQSLSPAPLLPQNWSCLPWLLPDLPQEILCSHKAWLTQDRHGFWVLPFSITFSLLQWNDQGSLWRREGYLLDSFRSFEFRWLCWLSFWWGRNGRRVLGKTIDNSRQWAWNRALDLGPVFYNLPSWAAAFPFPSGPISYRDFYQLSLKLAVVSSWTLHHISLSNIISLFLYNCPLPLKSSP